MDDGNQTEDGRIDGKTRNTTPDGIGRRRYLTLTGATIGTAAVAGCTGFGSQASGGGGNDSDTDSGSSPTDTLVFIETPGNRPGQTKKQWMPFVEYLESAVDGLNVEIQFAQSYAASGQALKSGQAHMTSGDVIVLADPEAFDIVGISVQGGSSVYFSVMCTLPKYDGIEDLTDLKGKKIAFADPLSTSGSLYPTYALMQAGLNIGNAPYGDPVDYTATYSNHNSVRQQLFNRSRVKAGATYDDNIIDYIPREQIPKVVRERSSAWGETVGTKEPTAELLWNSKPIPNSPLVVASDWESPLRDEIIQAIPDIEAGTLRKPEGVELPITNVTKGSIEDYQPVIEVINALGVEFGDV